MSLQAFDTVLAFAAAMLILSLLVTAWVQFLSALLRLRSGNLEWGLRRLLEQLDPDDQLKNYRSLLVQHVIEHPALARDSTWFGNKAEAIKAEELVKTLRQLATAPNPDSMATAVRDWVASLTPAQGESEVQAQIDAITEEAGKLFPQQTQALRDAVERAIHRRDDLAQRVGQWFDSAMDRTSERFTLQCRWLTVVGAGIVVLVMGVDALWMLRQLNDKSQLREPLIAYAQEVQQQEEAATAKVCDRLVVKTIEPGAPASRSGAQAAGTQAASDAPGEAASAPALTDIESARACVELRRQQLTAAKKRLDQGVTALLMPGWWTSHAAGASVPTPSADAVGTPASGPTASRPGSSASSDAAAAGASPQPGIAGLLFGFVLLSLGAPFWFNVLKNLSSLRPLIASRSDRKTG